MQSVLITGGAGFIASSLTKALIKSGNYYVVAVDNFLTGQIENTFVHPNYKFIKCDVNDFRNISAIILSNKFDYIFHYAAVVGVLRTLKNPHLVLEDIKGLQNIFDLAKNTEVKRIFFSSSSEVYGEPVHLPQHELETPLNSKLPYAVVKNIGECFCRSYLQEYGLNYTILRFFNTYGPKQSNDFVISKFIHAAKNGDEITIYGQGDQTRTFCYIDDHIDFTLEILNKKLFINDVVNVGSNELVTIQKLAKLIIELTNSSSEIVYKSPLKDGDMTRRQPDNNKMMSVLNRKLISLNEGITNILKQ